MDFELTQDELDAIKTYKNEKYIEINQLLTNDIELDVLFANRSAKGTVFKRKCNK